MPIRRWGGAWFTTRVDDGLRQLALLISGGYRDKEEVTVTGKTRRNRPTKVEGRWTLVKVQVQDKDPRALGPHQRRMETEKL